MANEPGDTMMEVAKTMSVPEAGRRYFNIGKNASYDAAKRREIPVIRIGGRLRVPVVEGAIRRAGAAGLPAGRRA
jgi:hypothetical protein